MTRYELCLQHVKQYADDLCARNVNAATFERLIESYVDQPAYDVTFRAQLIRDALAMR